MNLISIYKICLENFDRFGNLLIRMVSSVLRFSLLTFLAKELSNSDYGLFSTITAYSALAVIIFGGELHTRTSRDISRGAEKHGIEKILFNHSLGVCD